jgi:hypothetical protein
MPVADRKPSQRSRLKVDKLPGITAGAIQLAAAA